MVTDAQREEYARAIIFFAISSSHRGATRHGLERGLGMLTRETIFGCVSWLHRAELIEERDGKWYPAADVRIRWNAKPLA